MCVLSGVLAVVVLAQQSEVTKVSKLHHVRETKERITKEFYQRGHFQIGFSTYACTILIISSNIDGINGK